MWHCIITWVPPKRPKIHIFCLLFCIQSWWEHRIIPTLHTILVEIFLKNHTSQKFGFTVFIPHWNPIPPPWGKALDYANTISVLFFLLGCICSKHENFFAAQVQIFLMLQMFYNSQELHASQWLKKYVLFTSDSLWIITSAVLSKLSLVIYFILVSHNLSALNQNFLK